MADTPNTGGTSTPPAPKTDSASTYKADIRSFNLGARSDKTVYTLKDYKWYPAYETPNTINEINPPKIIVRELQPVEMFDSRAVTEGMMTMLFGSKGEKPDGGGGAASDGFKKMLGGTAVEGMKQVTEIAIRNPKFTEAGVNSATRFITKLVAYSTLRVFELPFYDQRAVYKTGGGEWSTDGSAMGPIKANFKAQTFSLSMPTPPTWKGTESNAGFGTLTTSFNLLNQTNMADSTDQLVKNFKFMINLLAGTYYMQIFMFTKSSNLYSIECPGRFFIPYAQMKVDVSFAGKTRINASAHEQLKSAGLLEGYSTNDILFPDMYHLTVTFEPQGVNNYNTFIQALSKKSMSSNAGLSTDGNYESEISGYHTRMNEAELYADMAKPALKEVWDAASTAAALAAKEAAAGAEAVTNAVGGVFGYGTNPDVTDGSNPKNNVNSNGPTATGE